VPPPRPAPRPRRRFRALGSVQSEQKTRQRRPRPGRPPAHEGGKRDRDASSRLDLPWSALLIDAAKKTSTRRSRRGVIKGGHAPVPARRHKVAARARRSRWGGRSNAPDHRIEPVPSARPSPRVARRAPRPPVRIGSRPGADEPIATALPPAASAPGRRHRLRPARQIIDSSRVGLAQGRRGLYRRSSGHLKGAPVLYKRNGATGPMPGRAANSTAVRGCHGRP